MQNTGVVTQGTADGVRVLSSGGYTAYSWLAEGTGPSLAAARIFAGGPGNEIPQAWIVFDTDSATGEIVIHACNGVNLGNWYGIVTINKVYQPAQSLGSGSGPGTGLVNCTLSGVAILAYFGRSYNCNTEYWLVPALARTTGTTSTQPSTGSALVLWYSGTQWLITLGLGNLTSPLLYGPASTNPLGTNVYMPDGVYFGGGGDLMVAG